MRHQLERLVPWRADNVLYTYDAAPASDGDGRLIVKVAATARSLHAPLLAAVNAFNPRKLRVLYPGAGDGGGDIAIPLDRGTASNGEMRRLRYGIAGALAAVLLISAAAFGYLFYSWQDVSDALVAAETSETVLRKQLGGRGPQETAASRDLRAILERKKAQPLTVLAVDALSGACPTTPGSPTTSGRWAGAHHRRCLAKRCRSGAEYPARSDLFRRHIFFADDAADKRAGRQLSSANAAGSARCGRQMKYNFEIPTTRAAAASAILIGAVATIAVGVVPDQAGRRRAIS